MVDLLGKKKLEEEIERLRSRVNDLEEEKGSLSLQIERREEKIRKLTSAQQETSLALQPGRLRIPLLAPASILRTSQSFAASSRRFRAFALGFVPVITSKLQAAGHSFQSKSLSNKRNDLWV